MKRTFFALGFLVIAYVGLAAEVDPKSLYVRSRPAVVLITTSNPSGLSIALGTGFAVSDGTRLVTNLHVIQGATTVKIKTADNREYDIKYVSGHDVAHDLAVLECPVQLPQLSLTDEEPSVGDVIFTIGNPQGLEGSFSEGLVSGLRKLEGSSVYQISAAVSPGSSGGPVLNQSGAVIAVTTFGMRAGQNLNFAIPIRYIKPLLGKPSKTLISALRVQKSSDISAKNEIRRLWNQGTKMLARKKAAEFVEENPQDPAVAAFVGDVMYFSGEWDAAISLYEKVIDLAPTSNYRYLWLWIALSHTYMSRYDEALTAFEHLGPKSDFSANLLWQIYMTELAAGRVQSARATAKILTTARDDEEIKSLIQHFARDPDDKLTTRMQGVLLLQVKKALENNARSRIPEQ
jgi:serine protease Do